MKSCIGQFKFPKCLSMECRHKCVQKFNRGKLGERKILINLEAKGNSIKEQPKKVVKKAVDVNQYDKKTLDDLSDVFVGTAFGRAGKAYQGNVKWLYKGRVVLWVRKAVNGEIQMRVPKDFQHKDVQIVKTQRILTVSLTNKNIKMLRKALLDWLSNLP